jgi:transcriptional regulator with XRE-family HTH domain
VESVLNNNTNMQVNKYKLAKDMGVSHQAVYKWFNGQSKPNANKLRKIATLLGLTVDELLELLSQ